MLTIPYRLLYPTALFFICIGVFSTNNELFQVGETLVLGVFGLLLLALDFHPAPILLGFVLGPRLEENFRRALLISRGDLGVFVESPISAGLLLAAALLIGVQVVLHIRRSRIRAVTV
jgi:TctA family transporter